MCVCMVEWLYVKQTYCIYTWRLGRTTDCAHNCWCRVHSVLHRTWFGHIAHEAGQRRRLYDVPSDARDKVTPIIKYTQQTLASAALATFTTLLLVVAQNRLQRLKSQQAHACVRRVIFCRLSLCVICVAHSKYFVNYVCRRHFTIRFNWRDIFVKTVTANLCVRTREISISLVV